MRNWTKYTFYWVVCIAEGLLLAYIILSIGMGCGTGGWCMWPLEHLTNPDLLV